MAQYLRPIDDFGGSWQPSEGSDLYACVDEETPDDGDYIYIETTTGTYVNLLMDEGTDPQVGTGHTVRWRWRSVGSNPIEKGDAWLMEGLTQRAILAEDAVMPRTWTAASYTLSEAEANNITDYSDLRVRFNADTLGAGEQLQVSWVELEIPDAPAEGGVSNLMLLGVG